MVVTFLCVHPLVFLVRLKIDPLTGIQLTVWWCFERVWAHSLSLNLARTPRAPI